MFEMFLVLSIDLRLPPTDGVGQSRISFEKIDEPETAICTATANVRVLRQVTKGM